METPVGTIIAWFDVLNTESSGAVTFPDGWVECDGKSHQLSAEGASITVPDLRGVFLRGADAEFPPKTRGGSDVIPPHSHSVNVGGTPVNMNAPHPLYKAGGAFGGDPLDIPAIDHRHSAHVEDRTVDSTENAGHDNRPSFLSVRFIIRIR